MYMVCTCERAHLIVIIGYWWLSGDGCCSHVVISGMKVINFFLSFSHTCLISSGVAVRFCGTRDFGVVAHAPDGVRPFDDHPGWCDAPPAKPGPKKPVAAAHKHDERLSAECASALRRVDDAAAGVVFRPRARGARRPRAGAQHNRRHPETFGGTDRRRP